MAPKAWLPRSEPIPVKHRPPMRPPTPEERRILFSRGFGDGAKGSPATLESMADYLNGYTLGVTAREEATLAFCSQHGLPVPERAVFGTPVQPKTARSAP